MKSGKVTAILAASALAAAPTAAYSAAPLSLAQAPELRVGASLDGSSELRGRRSASMVLGFVLLVVIIAIALSNGDGPDSP